MLSNEGLISTSSITPDLDEFLSALNGFLSKQETPADPSHLKFLEIFFRTVKAAKGHLLKLDEKGGLHSVVCYGISSEFDAAYNSAHDNFLNQPSPLDVAFREQEALAIVELSKEPDIPTWYLNLMKRHGFVSLVAVPLMGRDKPVGVLCAYYHDACLFDRGTLAHLMMIGRMVGGATEKSQSAVKPESADERTSGFDNFLTVVTTKKISKSELYMTLSEQAAPALGASGVLSGPITKTNDAVVFEILGGTGISVSTRSKMVVLPDFLSKGIVKALTAYQSGPMAPAQWGHLKSIVGNSSVVVLSKVLFWQNQPHGIVFAWRPADRPFLLADEILMNRFGAVASLALRTI